MRKKLEVFLAVADELHFDRASARVGAEAYTVSRKIGELEREFGVRLFDRSRQGTSGITPAGLTLEPFARQILAKVNQALTAVREASPDRRDELHIGLCDEVPFNLVSTVLRRLRLHEPALEVHMVDDSCEALIQDLQTGMLDIGFTLGGGLPAHPGLVAEPLWASPLLVLLPEDHPLTGRDSLSLSDIVRERLIMGHRQCDCGWQSSLEQLLSCAGKPRIQEASNLNVLKILVEAGGGLGIVSTAQVERAQGSQVALRPLAGSEWVARTYLLRRRDVTPAPLTRFVEVARTLG